MGTRVSSLAWLPVAAVVAVVVGILARSQGSSPPEPSGLGADTPRSPGATADGSNGSGGAVPATAARLTGRWEMDWTRFGALRGDSTEVDDPNISIFDGVGLMFIDLDATGTFRAEHVRFDGGLTVFEGTWSADDRGNAGGPTMTTVHPDGLTMVYDVEWEPSLMLVGPLGANAIRPRLPLRPYDPAAYPGTLHLDRLCDHGPIAMQTDGEGVAFDLSTGPEVARGTIRAAHLGGVLAAWQGDDERQELQVVGLDACGLWLRVNRGPRGAPGRDGAAFVVSAADDRRYRIGSPGEEPIVVVTPWVNGVLEVEALRELDAGALATIDRTSRAQP